MSRIRSIHAGLTAKKYSCREITTAYLEAIRRDDPTLRAYVAVTAEQTLAAADRVDALLAQGAALPPLAGIPMALKDNISTKDIPTTCCSRMLAGFTPIYDATVWQRLQRQQAVLLGKTNMDEFAMGTTCETSCFGGARNPHAPAYLPGGSSGGSAAAVGGHLAVYALGSDTGGSIRQPASWCGVVGLKPTYGGVSRYGLIAFASGFDQIGPIAETVEDVALVWDAIAGHDPMDTTSCPTPIDPAAPTLRQDIRGCRIGILPACREGCAPAVQAAFDKAVACYKALGAEIIDCSLPLLEYALPVYHVLTCAEASSNLGRYDGIRYGHRTAAPFRDVTEQISLSRSEGFGREVQRRILLGTYVLSAGHHEAYYQKAQRLRGAIAAGFDGIFTQCDAILTPTAPMTAFPADADIDTVRSYQVDRFTVPANLAGLPALSLPCGMDEQGLPIGLQLIGPRFGEAAILRMAYAYEQTGEAGLPAAKGGVAL